MKFIYGRQDVHTLERAQENGFLLTNGLGGYASLSAACSVTRCDQGVLIAAQHAPNVRAALVHRLSERLRIGGEEVFLSSQAFAGKKPREDGYTRLSCFSYAYTPEWTYHVRGVQVKRRMAMAHERNAAAVRYDIENDSDAPCRLTVAPGFLMAPKGEARTQKARIVFEDGCVSCGAYRVYLQTDGELGGINTRWERLAYPDDQKDGRAKSGLCAACCEMSVCVMQGERASLRIVFSAQPDAPGADEMLCAQERRLRALEDAVGFADSVARRLALSADAYFSRKEATGGMTLLAGYPLFGDWGRDTMISLPGCALSCGRYEEARSILDTFLAYEKDGLVPNLFPEGGAAPMYNTVDAALLLINAVWLYHEKTGDTAFVSHAWPVVQRIVSAYRRGTHHAIFMDEDGLISAGEGFDQVTWMDVRIGDVLPTPRHGKCVEINAYWYNALKIMEAFAALLGEDAQDYGELAARVSESFIRGFYMEEKGALRDVLSGTAADEQIRCNQIWAVTMPFTMLSAAQASRVVKTVGEHLYTPCGLRTLSPEDPQFHAVYGGSQLSRDLAYHQGTAWVFPLGAYYLALLRVSGDTLEAAQRVRALLEPVHAMLREGCAGHLPEIYDGGSPGQGKGCFAQAWSVGEMLRVYEKLEQIERHRA